MHFLVAMATDCDALILAPLAPFKNLVVGRVP